jgi:hypothetical protein
LKRALIDPDNPLWRNVLGLAAAAVILPVAIVVKLIIMPFERPAKRTAEDVARSLRYLVDETRTDWDETWDSFTCIPIADPRLDSIRDRVARIDLPLSEEGRRALRTLLAEAEAIACTEIGTANT